MNKIKKWPTSLKNQLKTADGRIKFGLILWFSAMWSWTLLTDSLDLAGSKTQGFILAIIISAINVALSTWIVWTAWKLARKLFAAKPIWQALLVALPLFALIDFLVAWLVAIIWIGPQGLIDSVLPLSSPALMVINTPLAFAGRLIGYYGLGAFIWLTLFMLTEKKIRTYAIIPVLVLSVLSFVGWAGYRSVNGSGFNATVITETLTNRVPQIDSKQTDLVIFPEYGLDEVTNKNLDKRLTIDKAAQDPTAFLGSEQVNPLGRPGHLNRLLFGNSKDGIVSYQDKYRLIPGGEDLPYTLRVALRATNQVSTLDYFSFAKSVIRGQAQLSNYVINETTNIGAAVCSSIISPEDYRYFVNNGATALTNSASLTIFKGSRMFSWQQKSLARFMAISNSRYFMQSANGSRAYILNNNGDTIVEKYGINTASSTVYNNSKRTPYTIIGEWLVFIGALLALGGLARHVLKKRQAISEQKPKKATKKSPKAKAKRYNKS
jgi:hypothetical protein